MMGWMPEYGGLSGFERGLSQTIEWFLDPGNLSRYKIEVYNL